MPHGGRSPEGREIYYGNATLLEGPSNDDPGDQQIPGHDPGTGTTSPPAGGGDSITFDMEDDQAGTIDLAFVEGLESTLTEWESESDEAAYRDL